MIGIGGIRVWSVDDVVLRGIRVRVWNWGRVERGVDDVGLVGPGRWGESSHREI